MKQIDGKKIAAAIREELKAEVASLQGRKPGLAFLLIGEDSASQAYVRMKVKGCQEVGIHSEVIALPESIKEEALLSKIDELNQNEIIDGFLVQQPFPSHINTSSIIEAVTPEKDVDGFHPLNLGKVMLGDDSGFVPCTLLGILKLLEKCELDPKGKHVVIIGRSTIVGKPLAALLMQKRPYANGTVTVAHSQTQNLKELSLSADFLITALGKPKAITADMVKEGAVVIDVGINRIEKRMVGDVDFDQVKDKCAAITPVPGGVGPMTIAMLLSNTLLSYKRRCQGS